MRIKAYNAKQWEIRAILDGRKTVTRRCVKYKYSNTEMKMHTDKYGTRLIEIQKDVEGETFGKNPDGSTWRKLLGYIEPKPPYQPGDTLYVRETWGCYCRNWWEAGYFLYKADYPDGVSTYEFDGHICDLPKWRPSIHMPKEAARIFLRVTDTRVERLQDINAYDCKKEGIWDDYKASSQQHHDVLAEGAYLKIFSELWNSTLKKSDLARYGWDANPWVWVIEFERMDREKINW